MKQISDAVEYNTIVEKYSRYGVLSNDYLHKEVRELTSNRMLYVDCYENNAFFFVLRDAGIRVYYYINDLNESVDFSKYENLVIEILFRNDIPHNEMDFFLDKGFKKNLIRDQYSGLYKDMTIDGDKQSQYHVGTADSYTEVQEACKLFNSTFDRLSGDYIPETMYKGLLDTGKILVVRDRTSHHLLGALHQDKEGAVNILRHVAVVKQARGLGVGKAILNAFIENNHLDEKTRYMLWVQRQNEAAVNMYRHMGFKFLNKSTISLIK